jgi:hypothetical protein
VDVARISWPLLILRGLYPLLNAGEYRVRALAAFFPYMNGLATWNLSYFNYAARLGYDVDWLKSNLNHTFSNAAYEALIGKKIGPRGGAVPRVAGVGAGFDGGQQQFRSDAGTNGPA